MTLSSSFLHQHPETRTHAHKSARLNCFCGSSFSRRSVTTTTTTTTASIMVPVNNATSLFVCVVTCENFQETRPGYHCHLVFESHIEQEKNNYIFMIHKCGKKKLRICSKESDILCELKYVLKEEISAFMQKSFGKVSSAVSSASVSQPVFHHPLNHRHLFTFGEIVLYLS